MEAALAVSEGDSQVLFARPTQALRDEEAEEYLDDQLGAMATAAAIGLVNDALRQDDGAEAPLHLNPEIAFLQAEASQRIRLAIAELSTAERTVVERYYLNAEQMDQIARDMNVNKSWVSRLHARAISRLSKRLLGEAPEG
jgi:RNA polymerase sigma factor (sigma-70 family)